MSLMTVETTTSAHAYADPLDDDQAGDVSIRVSVRALTRLALVASETGARFQRDGIAHDPMAWILAPRRMFGGRAALEASLELDGCTRAMLLHGLALGLDADQDELDELVRGDDPCDAATSAAEPSRFAA